MATASYQARRANLDDLETLRKFWVESGFSAEEMENRLTEFQVVCGPEGELLAGVRLQLSADKTQALLDTECYSQADLLDASRTALWERIQVLSQNHGFTKLWTTEVNPFWRHYAGFREPTGEELPLWPGEFGPVQRTVLIVSLRNEDPATEALKRQLDLYLIEQQQRLESLKHWQGLAYKIALLIAFIIFTLTGVLAFHLLRHRFHW